MAPRNFIAFVDHMKDKLKYTHEIYTDALIYRTKIKVNKYAMPRVDFDTASYWKMSQKVKIKVLDQWMYDMAQIFHHLSFELT